MRYDYTYTVDCVINFWNLARAMKQDPEELFYSLFPNDDYDKCPGRYVEIDCYEKMFYDNKEENKEAWQEVRFYVEESGDRFYDKVLMIF